MKDLFNSEQLEALRHHFPNISKAMEGERPTQANHQKQRFRYGYVTPAPKGERPNSSLSLNGVLRRSDSEEILQGSENGCVLILKKKFMVWRSSGRVVPPLAAGRSRPMIFK